MLGIVGAVMRRVGRSFLLVEGRARAQRAYARLLAPFGRVVCAEGAREAERAIETDHFDAYVLGVLVGAGSTRFGTELLRRLRARGLGASALVISADEDPRLPSTCLQLGAVAVFEPVDPATFAVFAARLPPISSKRAEHAHLVDIVSVERRLTIRESQVARLVTHGIDREALAERLDISENSLKGIVRGLLRKTGYESVEALRRGLIERSVRRRVDGADLQQAKNGVRHRSHKPSRFLEEAG
jgi:DNA-binding NarL/FixJ family response regulator